MVSGRIYLGVVLAITIIIIAYFAWRRWKKEGKKSKFSYGTPATPLVRDKANQLINSLNQVVEDFNSIAEKNSATPPYLTPLMGSMRRASAQLSKLPPTYANYFGIYQGLQNADHVILAASDEIVQNTKDENLKALGKQLRHVVQAIHQLGAALELE